MSPILVIVPLAILLTVGLTVAVNRRLAKQERINARRRNVVTSLESLHPGCSVTLLSNDRYLLTDKRTGKALSEYPLESKFVNSINEQ